MEKGDVLITLAIIFLLINTVNSAFINSSFISEESLEENKESTKGTVDLATNYDWDRSLNEASREKGEVDNLYWRNYEEPLEDMVTPFIDYNDDESSIENLESENQDIRKSYETSMIQSEDLRNHDPIAINNDSDLENLAVEENLSGKGTEEDPYMIQGYDIDGAGNGYSFYIGNVTQHLIVKDSHLYNATGGDINEPFSGSGMILFNSKNVQIENNSIYENNLGVDIWDSSDNILDKNHLFENGYMGLRLDGAFKNVISNNSISNNEDGIKSYASIENEIFNNTIDESHNGISLYSSSKGNFFSSNSLNNNINNIVLHNSDENEIQYNILENAQTGIEVDRSSKNNIQNNTVRDVSDDGIVLMYSTNNFLRDNQMENTGIRLEGESRSHWDSHSIPTSNTVNGGPIYYWVNQTGGSIGSPAGQIILINSTDVNIEDVDVSQTGTGLFFIYSDHNTIDNTVSSMNNNCGLLLKLSNSNTIKNSNFNDNHEGTHLKDSESNRFENNTINENQGGVVLSRSKSTYLINNSLENNQNSVDIHESNETNLKNNSIIDSSRYGIIISSSMYNSFIDNTILGNGFYFEGDSLEYWNTHSIDDSNSVNGFPIQYITDKVGETIPSYAGQVIIVNSSDMEVLDQDLSGTCVGITLSFSNYNHLSNVTASSNTFYGIRMIKSDDNLIENSSFGANSDGMNIKNSQYNDFVGTEISQNSRGIIMWDSSDENTVSESKSINNNHGIFMYQTKGSVVQGSNISFNSRSGVSISSSEDVVVNDNVLLENVRDAISISFSENSNITGNLLELNGIIIRGNSLDHWNTHEIDDSNTVNDKPIYYIKNKTDLTVPTDAGQVILANSTGITVKDLNISQSSMGILLGFSDENHIYNNSIHLNYHSGIRIERSVGNLLEKNKLTENGNGLNFQHSKDNQILENDISDNQLGIYQYYSHESTFYNNSFDANRRGFYIFLGDENKINNNTITDSERYGFYVRSAKGNDIHNNRLSGNGEYGIQLSDAINNAIKSNFIDLHEDNIQLIDSEKNIVSNNTLVNADRYGIYIKGSQFNDITYNDISNNFYGIRLYGSDENIIEYNSINKGEVSVNDRYKSNEETNNHGTGSLLVRFNERILSAGNDLPARTVLEREADRVAEKIHGKTDRVFTTLPVAEIQLEGGINFEQTMEDISNMPEVAYAEPNYYIELEDTAEPLSTPNDPGYGSLWGMEKIDAPGAWDMETGSEEVVIGVVDTGIDYHHEDLVDNMWADNSGYHGYNAVNDSYYPMDGHGHGTHVAGTIGAVGDNEIGVVGVNWNVSLMALKIFDDSGSGTVSNAVASLEYVLQKKEEGVNVVTTSNSWGWRGGESAVLKEMIEQHRDADISFIAAAGNNGENNDHDPVYPASYELPNVISVAATDENDDLASFSNYGESSVHVAAPGVRINSTGRNDAYQSLSGTSMATPHVSGLIGLLSSYDETYNHTNLKNIVLSSVDKLDNLEDKTLTGGRINASAALNISTDPENPNFWLHSPTNMSEITVLSETEIIVSLTDGINPIYGADVEVKFSSGEDPIELYDDGYGSDEKGDGYYTGFWSPIRHGEIELEITAQIDDWKETRYVTVLILGGRTGVSLFASDYNLIRDNYVYFNNYRGVEIRESHRNDFINNSVSENNGLGFYSKESDHNILDGNEFNLNEEGIVLDGSDFNILFGNDVENNTRYGFYLIDSHRNEISNGTITANRKGGYLLRSENNTISEMDIDFNEEQGLYIANSFNNWITQNNIHYNSLEGLYIFDDSYNNSVISNSIIANEYGASVFDSNEMLFYNNNITRNHIGVYLESSHHNSLFNNSLGFNHDKGIYLYSSTNNYLNYNEILKNEDYGIYLLRSSRYNIIENNSVLNNRRGVLIGFGSNQNTVIDNNISSNKDDGIYIATNSNTVIGNKISFNEGYGLYLSGSNNNFVGGNEISYNADRAFYMRESDENTLKNNTLQDNEDHGLYIRNSELNEIYHNNFIDNIYQVYDNGNNIWNATYPKGGNYFSDHTEPDDYRGPDQDEPGSDAIVDVPYEIDGSENQDNYPFISKDGWETRIMEISLKACGESDGWNFVSFNLIPLENSLESILEDPENGISGNYDKLMYFDSETDNWLSYMPERADHFNDDYNWDHTIGVWIRMTNNDTLKIEGRLPTTTEIILDPGWNMVSLPSSTAGNHGLPSEVEKIGYFNSSSQYNLDYDYDPANFTFSPGQGYWIYNKFNGSVIWTVDY